MEFIWKKIKSYIKPFAERLEKWRWAILTGISFSLLWVEIQEFLVLRVLNQPFHYFEVFQYTVLLIATGLLIELFARSNRAHKQALKILEYKHRLSLEFTSNDDWESLIRKLTELPTLIADVEETYLLINNQMTGKFETAGHWALDKLPPGKEKWNPTILCAKCSTEIASNKPSFHLCQYEDHSSVCSVYSLSIPNQNFPTTILKFKLEAGKKLFHDEEEIFKNIGDEITIALQTSQDRKRLSEMQSAEVAMAERRIVSSYVHDELAQNLGYLHLKLDQLSTSDDGIESKDIKKDLKHLQEVANESYEIVRDILKKIQPETIPHLTNLLREHAKTVSRRANFTLNFKSIGEPVHVATNLQQLIFFTFRESLSNVEKHSCATTVDVLVIWNHGFLEISVADNGKGFDPDLVQRNEHFGLVIMQERIANIKGSLTINSSVDSGTVVSISVPVDSTMTV
jgi:signal transduction histidine kinase